MKTISIIILTLSVGFTCSSQVVFTGKKGPRFMPGHRHIVISVDGDEIHYQLFNHWYAISYAQHRDISISMSEIEKYGKQNDTMSIILKDNKIKLTDKRYKLKKTIKHQKLCESVENMRKISYAHLIASKYDEIKHFHLYELEDLDLSEEEFIRIVDVNLEEELKKATRQQ